MPNSTGQIRLRRYKSTCPLNPTLHKPPVYLGADVAYQSTGPLGALVLAIIIWRFDTGQAFNEPGRHPIIGLGMQ
jgi:hypothetical protein